AEPVPTSAGNALAVENAEIHAPLLDGAGGEFHPDLVSGSRPPDNLAVPSDASVGRELQHELIGRLARQGEPRAGLGHVLHEALIDARARPEIDPGWLADRLALALALFNHRQEPWRRVPLLQVAGARPLHPRLPLQAAGPCLQKMNEGECLCAK